MIFLVNQTQKQQTQTQTQTLVRIQTQTQQSIFRKPAIHLQKTQKTQIQTQTQIQTSETQMKKKKKKLNGNVRLFNRGYIMQGLPFQLLPQNGNVWLKLNQIIFTK